MKAISAFKSIRIQSGASFFSVWSPFDTDDPNSIPEDQKVRLLKRAGRVYRRIWKRRFRRQSYLHYPWRAGVTYRFLLRVPSAVTIPIIPPGFTHLKPVMAAHCQLSRPQTDTYLVALFLSRKFHSRNRTTSRYARYSNQWVCDTRGQWHELTRAHFTADATARKGNRLDYAGGMQNGFLSQECGFFNERTEIDTDFEQ